MRPGNGYPDPGRYPPDILARHLLVLCPPCYLLAGEARGRCYILLHGKICEKGPYFLLAHLSGVGLVVEHDKPFDPLNIRRDRPGTVITGTHYSSYMVKEPGPVRLARTDGPGLILRIISVHVIKSINMPASSSQVV